MPDMPPKQLDNQPSEAGDWVVHQFFSDADLRMSPEEYAARHAHEWGCFSCHLYQFRDEALGAWIRRLHEILVTEGEAERCRQRYLTAEELKAVRERAAQEW